MACLEYTQHPYDIYYVYFEPGSRHRIIRVDFIENTEIAQQLSEYGIKVIDLRSLDIWAFRYNSMSSALAD